MVQEPRSNHKVKPWWWLARAWRRGVATARSHPFRFWGVGVALALGVVLAGFAWNSLSIAVSVESDVSDIADSLRGSGLQRMATSQGYADLARRVDTVERKVETLGARANLLRGFVWLPWIGPKIREGTLVLDMTEHFVRGSSLATQGYGAIAYALDTRLSSEEMARVRRDLETSHPLFEEAQRELDRAKELRSQLEAPVLGGRVQSALERIDRYLPLVELATAVARDSPQVVTAVLGLRKDLSELRTILRDPSAFMERPQELEKRFAVLQEQALGLQKELLILGDTTDVANTTVTQALDIALQLSVVLGHLGEGMKRFAGLADATFSLGPFTPEAGRLAGDELPQIRALVQAAQHELDQLSAMLTSPEGGESAKSLLALASRALGSYAQPFQREEELLETGLLTIDFLTLFLGFEGPKTYLLIGQNDDEIRATGGFLGVVVELTMENGQLVGLKYMDSDMVDAPPYDTNPYPPEPIYRYLWMAKLLFRDGNWSPHFPATAAQIADLYERGQGVNVDGVVAATEEVVLDMVDALGGVRIPQEGLLLDRELAERYVEGELPYTCQARHVARHVARNAKRCFDEDLFQTVMGRLLGPLAPQERGAVVKVLLDRLQKRDVLIHVFDPRAAQLLWERSWNGAMRQVDHDYLMVVDSSLPGHARSAVERRVQYQVALEVGLPSQVELLLEYRHRGEEPDPDCRQALPYRFGCFWDYVRVYIPVVAQDVQAPPVPLHEGSEWLIWGYEPADSLSVISSPRGGLAGLTEIGAYLVVEPQTSVTLPLRYALPPSVVQDVGGGIFQYRLLIQKQSGVPVEPVALFVQLPEGAVLVRSSPEPSSQIDRWVRMDAALSADVTFTVDFRLKG